MTLQTAAYIVCTVTALAVLTPTLFVPYWRNWRWQRRWRKRGGYIEVHHGTRRLP